MDSSKHFCTRPIFLILVIWAAAHANWLNGS